MPTFLFMSSWRAKGQICLYTNFTFFYRIVSASLVYFINTTLVSVMRVRKIIVRKMRKNSFRECLSAFVYRLSCGLCSCRHFFWKNTSGSLWYPLPIVQGAVWVPGPVWMGAEILASNGIRSPNRPAHSEYLFRLRYLNSRTGYFANNLQSLVDTNICGHVQFYKRWSKYCIISYTLENIVSIDVSRIQIATQFRRLLAVKIPTYNFSIWKYKKKIIWQLEKKKGG